MRSFKYNKNDHKTHFKSGAKSHVFRQNGAKNQGVCGATTQCANAYSC